MLSVFNLCEGMDVAHTEKRVKAYEEANQEQITATAAKMVRISAHLQSIGGIAESLSGESFGCCDGAG